MQRNRIQIQTIQEFDRLEIAEAKFTNYRFPSHFHDTYVIQRVLSGIDRSRLRGRTYEFSSNQLTLIEPGEVHTGQPGCKEILHYRAIYPTQDWIASILDLDASALRTNCDPIQTDPSTIQSFDRMYNAMSHSTDCLKQQETILDFLTRIFPTRHNRIDSAVHLMNDQAVEIAKDYLRSNMESKISLDRLASECGYSKFHTIRLFKNSVGMTPYRYLMNCRVVEAKRLIKKRIDLSEVAYRTGFSDQSHMTRVFADHFGYTPGQLQLLA